MAKAPKAVIPRGKETEDIFIEDLRGAVWNSMNDSGLTWQEISIRAGCKNATVSKFAYGETRRPVFRTVYKIAEALGIKLSYSVGRSKK